MYYSRSVTYSHYLLHQAVSFLMIIREIKLIMTIAYGSCWGSTPKICNETWVQATAYLEVIGIIIGQVLVGIIGDW